MFDNIPTAGQSNGADEPKKEVEDMFSGTEGEARAAMPVSEPSEETALVHSENENKYIIIGAMILALIIISIGGIIMYNKISNQTGAFIESPKQEVKKENQEENKVAEPVSENKEAESNAENASNKTDDKASSSENNEAGNSGTTTAATSTADQAIQNNLDSDQDGLTDQREKELGTDINNIDTDSDGLFDREEVEVYKTNSLNKDSDGDGYIDGEEVKGGYNPNGPGKLYEIK